MAKPADNCDCDSRVENAIAVLPVTSLSTSLRFFTELLGFSISWETATVAEVRRDAGRIMLQEPIAAAGPRTPTLVWIGVGESLFASLWEQFEAKSPQSIAQRPTNQRYALEMRIHDPDGNTLWFGTDPVPDTPFGQEVGLAQIRRHL